MSGRPIRFVTIAAASALAPVVSSSAANAGCYSHGCSYTPTYVTPAYTTCGGCGTTYVEPTYTYVVRRVYYTSGCGYSTCGTPVYPVDLGPTYTTPVSTPTDDADY